MADAGKILSDWWRATGGAPEIAAGGGATVQEIEKRYGVMLPDDFRAYVAGVAPNEDFWDVEEGIWWSPDRIKSIPDEYDHWVTDMAIAEKAGSYLFFADFMIWAWAWAICCDDSEDRGKVAV